MIREGAAIARSDPLPKGRPQHGRVVALPTGCVRIGRFEPSDMEVAWALACGSM